LLRSPPPGSQAENRALYKAAALNCSERLIMLCDKARVLARSDRPETMPEIR
jgi:hypothetical protein